MRLWSFQSLDIVEKLQNNIPYVCDFKKSPFKDEEQFVEAYSWLIEKLSKRIVKPDHIDYPVWAWYSYNGANKKPDLRTYQAYNDSALLELEIDDSRIVLTDFVIWHDVLNNVKSMTDEEWEISFENNIKYSQKEIEESWDRIFHIDKSLDHSIQANFWSIFPEDIVKIHKINKKIPKKWHNQY